MVEPSLASPLPTQRNKTINQSGLRDHSRGPWHQYNTNSVRHNWILSREQKGITATIAEEGITLAKDPLGSGRGCFCLNSPRVTMFCTDTQSSQFLTWRLITVH